MEELNGVWRTVGGRRIFIKTGQSLSEAMIESGKFPSGKSFNDGAETNVIRKPEDIKKEEIEEIYKFSQELNEDGMKRGVRNASMEKLGCNKKYPTVLSKEEYENSKGKEIFRGDGAITIEKAKEYQNQFLNGNIHIGVSNSGAGVWFSENQGVATGYQDGSNNTTSKNSKNSYMTYAKIKENAKIISSEELPTPLERFKMLGFDNKTNNDILTIVRDDGIYATLLGYDGVSKKVNFGKVTNYCITNRNVLEVREYE